MRRLKVQRSGLLCAAVLIGLYMWAGQAGLPVEAADLSTAVFYVL